MNLYGYYASYGVKFTIDDNDLLRILCVCSENKSINIVPY